jgi:hypothetical protein
MDLGLRVRVTKTLTQYNLSALCTCVYQVETLPTAEADLVIRGHLRAGAGGFGSRGCAFSSLHHVKNFQPGLQTDKCGP